MAVKCGPRLCPVTFGLSTHRSSHPKPVLYFTLTNDGWVGSLRNLSAALLADTVWRIWGVGAMWEPEHMQALEAEVGSLAPEVHSEVPGWARLEKHPGGRMLSRPALAGQALPHQTSAAPTDSALSG